MFAQGDPAQGHLHVLQVLAESSGRDGEQHRES